MTTDIDLRQLLADFDGVHTATLEEIAATLPSDAEILNGLSKLALSEESRLQSASTWLLKRFAEGGARLDDAQSRALLGVLLRESGWEAKLHVLQMLGDVTIPAENAPRLWAKLSIQTDDSNKLIRAWSYHGLVVLAEQHPSYRVEVGEWLARGEADEAPAVRARIRQLRKRTNWS